MKAKTKIHCNGCKYLKTIKRQIKKGSITDRNIWMLFCDKSDIHIDTIEVNNQDLNNANMPEIESPFVCFKRQELRVQNKEAHFETSIN